MYPECRCLGKRVTPWHQVGPPEALPEIAQPPVQGTARFADVHQEVLAGRPDAVEAGFVGDLVEGVLVGAERDPRGPGEGAPVVEEVRDIFGIFYRLVGIGRHWLYII